MTTLTLDHLSEPQRQALQGPLGRTANAFDQLAARLASRADQAQARGMAVLSHGLRGYAHLARDLATPVSLERWNVADPAADVPAALLTPDGRYSCDGCEAATERVDLVERPEGFLCPDCAQPGARA
ncbi:MAG: hypothetical protein KBO60_18290 [Achromobacter sp.]|nr:hypothetical protein [Achromobacter sp.]